MSLSKHQNTSRPRVYTPIVLVCTFVCLAISGIILLNSRKSTTQPPTATPTIKPYRISTGDRSYAITTNVPNQMKFVSPKLGISFLYSQIEGLPTILTKEESDKVYTYADYHYSGFDYHNGIYVQVFHKDPQDDLATAFQKTILKGYSQKDCFVKKTISYMKYITAYETAIITFPHDQNAASINQEYIAASEKCPPTYTPTNYVAYFAMDKNHPEKFVFFKIGQSSFPAEPEKNKSSNKADITWDETLQFLQ
jgi:hypothetical protein